MTMTYKIDYLPAEATRPCKCCGKCALVLWRDIYEAGEQVAALWFELAPHARDVLPVGYLLFEPKPEAKAFRLEIAQTATGISAAIEDPIGEVQPCLTRDEALAHVRRDEVFAIFDAVVERDAALLRWLERPGYDA